MRFYTRQIEQVLGYCSQIQWLLIKLSFDCGLRITELPELKANEYQRQDDCILAGVERREVAYESGLAKD